MEDAESVGDVVHAWVEGEEAARSSVLHACAFFDKRVHFGNGLELHAQLGWKSQRARETWARICIHGQYLTADVCITLREQSGERGLAHTTFTSNCKLHIYASY